MQRAVVVIIAILESAVKVVAVTDVVVTQITVARIKRSFLLKDIISTNKLSISTSKLVIK